MNYCCGVESEYKKHEFKQNLNSYQYFSKKVWDEETSKIVVRFLISTEQNSSLLNNQRCLSE